MNIQKVLKNMTNKKVLPFGQYIPKTIETIKR